MSELTVTTLKGVGKALSSKLATLNIETIYDLIFHLPLRYQDRTRITPLGELIGGKEVLICGQIQATSLNYGRRRSLIAKITDGTGWLTIRWFHFSRSQQTQIKRNIWISAFATIRQGREGVETVHPEYRLCMDRPENITRDRLTPVYPLTGGITQKRMRGLVYQALSHLSELDDYLDVGRELFEWPGLYTALQTLHAPPKDVDIDLLVNGSHPAQKRMALEELLAHHISLKRLKQRRQSRKSPNLSHGIKLCQSFLKILPFALTGDQQKVINEISADINQTIPMQRLVQGDVGSGKTVVAASAIFQCVGAGYQVAIMAPTELLAEQHLVSFSQWLEPHNISVEWLSGRLTGSQRKTALANLASGKAKVVIGTHALFQDEVKFNNMGLVVVDEQHRFGVNQRLALIDKGRQSGFTPHQLAMTATPIPRTLAMIFYADMDVSSIEELPPGRKPVDTILVSELRRDEVVGRVLNACQFGRQAYWVCPLIEESEVIQAQAATDIAHVLTSILSGLRIDLIHGQLKSEEKNKIMRDFRDHKIDVLVATTVIEVGVDVPNASLMIIENSERLGLAQLHQLRGRIGRDEIQSCCILMYHLPLSQLAKKRLSVIRNIHNGFKIAQYDLELRGPGELLGTRQTGLQQLKVANLIRDRDLFGMVERIGRFLTKNFPDNANALVKRWVKQAERYINV